MLGQTRTSLAIVVLVCLLSLFGGVSCNGPENPDLLNKSDLAVTGEPSATIEAVGPSDTSITPEKSLVGSNTTQELEIITDHVIGIRGLDLLGPLDSNRMSREELRDFLLESFREDYPLETAAIDEEILRLLNLIPKDLDLFELYVNLYSAEVAGLYDDETKKIYMVAEENLAKDDNDPVLAHEIVHALQDQHFDLTAMVDIENDSDRRRAVVSLVEGDATLVQGIYFNQFLTRAEQNQLQLDSEVSMTFLNAPMFIQETLLFPYQYGSTFARALFDRGGWDLINQALMDPPQSTAEILHPDLYLSKEELPQLVQFPDLASLMGPTWALEMEDTVGEFVLRLHLSTELHPLEIDDAARGWAGDRLVYLKDDDGAYCLIIKIVWQDSEDGNEFFETYLGYLERRGLTDQDLIETENKARYWRNQPEGVFYMGFEGDQTLLIWASTTSILRQLVELAW